jgi:hypothetical protein
MNGKDTVDSLDLLVSEKALLSRAFELWDAETTGDPTRRGMEAKFIIRHLAIREAARDDVARALSSLDHPDGFAAMINSDRRPMREALFQVTSMTGGTSAAQLNIGQPFRQAMERARAVFESDWDDRFTEICHEARAQQGLKLHRATYIRRRAPARLNPLGPRWYERIGLIRAIHARYDFWRRSPTLQRRYLPESLQSAERAMFAGHAD